MTTAERRRGGRNSRRDEGEQTQRKTLIIDRGKRDLLPEEELWLPDGSVAKIWRVLKEGLLTKIRTGCLYSLPGGEFTGVPISTKDHLSSKSTAQSNRNFRYDWEFYTKGKVSDIETTVGKEGRIIFLRKGDRFTRRELFLCKFTGSMTSGQAG